MTRPDRLEFSSGHWEGGGLAIKLLRSGKLRVGTTGYVSSKVRLLDIPPERWQAFWQEVDQIGVSAWKESYSREIMDGTSWELDLAHNGRELHSINA